MLYRPIPPQQLESGFQPFRSFPFSTHSCCSGYSVRKRPIAVISSTQSQLKGADWLIGRLRSMRRPTPTTFALFVAGLVILALVIVLARERSFARPAVADSPVKSSAADGIKHRCGSQRTYDRIKLELFRRAVATRGSGREQFDRLSSYSVVRMERPLLTSFDQELGTLRCSGRLSLDLPPGVSAVGGRRSLGAEIDYVLQPAADGSGDVVILEGADGIVIPLATLAQMGSESLPAPATSSSAELGAVETQPAVPVPASQAPAPVPNAVRATKPVQPARPILKSKPSFNCRYARTRGEVAVCNDDALAALDRQMAVQYYRGISSADAGQRQALTGTRDRFLRYRDKCVSNACIADAYRARMQEIDKVLLGVRH